MKKLSSIILFICTSISFALEGGPTQPDYIQFEPSDMKDMVSLTSGNFSYSIPLGDVPSAYGSYPLALAYHAGVSPQQEATWVGLGWTLSPGSIVRDLRGVPDDQFHGGTLGYIYQYAATYSWTIDVSYSNGPFSVGVNMSSTGGFGVSATYGVKIAGVAQLGFTVSSDQGIGVSGSVGFGGGDYGLNASAMFNPKTKDVTVGAGVSAGKGIEASLGVQYTTGQSVSASVGMSTRTSNGKNSANILRASVRKGGTSASLGPVSVSVANSTSKGNSTASSSGLAIVIPTNVGVFSLGFNQTLQEYRMRSATSDYVYGYLYQAGPAVLAGGDENANKNANNIDHIPGANTGSSLNSERGQWNWSFKGRTLETLGDDKMQPAYDMFTVESEGVSGTFRAYPREEHRMFKLVSNYATDDKNTVDTYNPILRLDDKTHWPQSEEFIYKNADSDERIPTDYTDYKVDRNVNSSYADFKTYFWNEGNRMVYNMDEESDKPLTSGINFLFLGEGGYYESETADAAIHRKAGDVSDLLLKRSLTEGNKTRQYALYGSRKVEPIFEDVSPVSKIKGFKITNADGTKYLFTQPVKSYMTIDYSINQQKGVPAFVDRKMSKNKDFWKNFGTAVGELVTTLLWPPKLFEALNNMFSGSLDEKCKANPADVMELYSYQVNMNPYATQWLLTEIQGPDYIQLDKKENDISKNIGYNVRFHYTKPSLYQWRTPYAQPHVKSSEMPNFRMPRNGLTPAGCDTKMYQASFGVKEYVYLTEIETATHKVKFELNDPETEERVDGKGWYFDKTQKVQNANTEETTTSIPIVTTAALSLNVKSVSTERYPQLLDYYSATFEYDALYVNVDVPELLQEYLKKNVAISLVADYSSKLIDIGSENSIFFLDNKFKIHVDKDAKPMVEKTKGVEAKFGLYKIKLKKNTGLFYWKGNVDNASNLKLVLAENGLGYVDGSRNTKELTQCSREFSWSDLTLKSCSEKKHLAPPVLDWSDIIFAGDQNDPSMNQMRYLKKISYYKKKKDYNINKDNREVLNQDREDYEHLDLYREYNFNYDYSLHPRTLNSFCKGRYPENLANIQGSPLTADLNVCATNSKNNLYGKLTLKSLSEKGCQNGRCVSLPPFKFDYNVASQTSTKYSTKDAWRELSEQNVPKVTGIPLASSSSNSSSSSSLSSSSSSVPFRLVFYSSGYYDNLSDVDATIIASNNTTDEWGFWNPYANEDNHKVSQSFANYGAAAWSLNKVTDPAGGVMEIKYERDVYKNGEDHSNEHLYVPIYKMGQCRDLIDGIQSYNPSAFSTFDSKYDNNVCAQFVPMYWKDQCLGPRTAFWDYTKPKGYKGGDFDYMEELGLVKNNELNKNATMYFNAHSRLKTEVDCGPWGCSSCDRYRNVGLLGSTTFEDMYESNIFTAIDGNLSISSVKSRILVLKKQHEMFYAGFQLAADKINDDQAWKVLNINGNMWAKREYAFIKGGDVRVKSLVRYDIDRVAKTEYEYEPGEMAQLPDSAYNAVMGSRFNVDLISFAMPDLDMKPKSRIVGFDDNDLLYVPGATIMYPKVTVKNSDGDGKIMNGKSEFEYITSEKGIPKEYIDPVTKDSLKPFVHVNANVLIWGGDKNNGDYKVRPIVVTFEFLGANGNRIQSDYNAYTPVPMNTPNPMNVVLYQGRTVSFNFYSNNVKDIKKIRLTYSYKNDNNQSVTDFIGDIDGLHMNDFNEVSITVAHILKKWSAYKNWTRSQEMGYYPIMYKQIEYYPEHVDFAKVKEAKDVLYEQNIYDALFEKKITYRDFTAFLGMNTKTTMYRGNDDKAVLLKIDSSVYSTQVPDVLDGIAENKINNQDIDVASKVGRQVERWNSSRELLCFDKNDDCERSDMSLTIHKTNDKKAGILTNVKNEDGSGGANHEMSYFKEDISFEYKRYPAIQIASITINGFDNQEKQFDAISSSEIRSSSSCDNRCKRNQKRMHWSRIENHKYDPLTSNPTATLAKIPAENGNELRKLTVKLPHHAVLRDKDNMASTTELAKQMFKKNMLVQNFAEFVYFDSEPVDKSREWNNLEKTQYLKSFSLTPWNKYNSSLQYIDEEGNKKQVESSKYPYVEWGSFTSKDEPEKIIPNGKSLNAFVADYQNYADKIPEKDKFNGSYILQVNKFFKPVETKDVQNRVLSAHYSENGLYQTGIFFPAELNKTAAIVPVGDEISEVNIKTSIKDNLKVDNDKGGMIVLSSINMSKSIVENGDELVAEYRYKKAGQTWQTKRENVNELNISLSSGDVLNYLRIYPKKAEAKTYIYDLYGNIIQIVAEDNTSTFFEYNPLGQLIQSRNDDGVSFKSHHREFTNDDRNEIPWTESVISSSSSGN